MKNQVFISYSERDRAVAENIASVLNRLKISFVLNSNDVFPNGDFDSWDRISEQIRSSVVFLYVGSPSAYANSYAFKKLHYAIDVVENHRTEISTKGVITFLSERQDTLPGALRFLLSNVNHRTWEQGVFPVLIKDITTQLGLE